MNLVDHPAIAPCYEAAVVSILNACPSASEQQAEEMVDAITHLIITTLKTYVEENHDRTDSH